MIGETLGILADRYETSVAALAAANGIADVDRIRAGQTIRIPRAAPSRQEQRILVALTHAEALYRGALFPEAQAVMRDLRPRDTHSATLRARVELLRGRIDAAFGDRNAAREHFEAALALDPEIRLGREASPKMARLFPPRPDSPRP